MNRLHLNIAFYPLLLLLLISNGVKAQEQIHLLPDRSYAVSGDTLWFSVFIFAENNSDKSQVVHVQLDDQEKNHILKVSVLCNGGFGEGYLPIPDSLSTGIYVLNPFSLLQKNSEKAIINQKFINVYNRFDEGLNVIQIPNETKLKRYDQENGIKIKTDKESYRKGEKVLVSYDIPQNELSQIQKIFITTGVADPISEQYILSYTPTPTATNEETPVLLVEKNGVLISGKVTDKNSGAPVSNAIVLFSIPDSIPFFDYCVSDEKGMFYYYLRNAVGKADLIFQAITKNNQDCRIEMINNYIEVQNDGIEDKILTLEEEKFTQGILQASYFDKLFNGYKITGSEYFSKPMQFEYPFYGQPTKTYDPNLFVDLPNFQEISREILYGVQYRERKDEITIRLQNYGDNTIFNGEPLRLLDGIPVFDNNVFKPMETADIKKVDVVFYERFYGDLSFQGILSVYTKNRSLDWVDRDPKIGHFKYNCIQPFKNIEFSNRKASDINIPNFNKVLYRSSVDNFKMNNEFDFFTSDIKGDIEIRFVLINKNNQIKYCHKLIKVE